MRREKPDRQVGARTLELDRVEGALVELPAAGSELLGVRAPGLDRIVLVEAHCGRDRVPQAVDIRLPEHLLGLPGGRVGGDRPVDRATICDFSWA